MIDMSSSEYSKLFYELYARFEAGEITAEEVCKEMWKVDRVWLADPREPHDVPDDYIPPSSNC